MFVTQCLFLFYLSNKFSMWTFVLLFSCIITTVVGAPDRVTGHRGETLHIRCSYQSGYETHNKYLCKGECYFGRKNIIVESGSPAKDRFSLNDDKTARVFTITITDLRTEDEGTYWCAVSGLIFDDYSEVLLLVKHDEMITEMSTVRLLSATPSYISTSELNLQSSRKPAKSTISAVQPTDQSLSSTVSVVYISMGLIVVVVVLLVALMMLCKQKKGSKKPSRITQSGPSDPVSTVNILPDNTAEEVNYHDHEYQEIRELQPKNIHPTTTTITMYSTVNGPADSMIYSSAEAPADSMIYSSAEAPAVSMIYSTAEAPADSMIYSTAEAPADSMIYSTAEAPADSMIYSTAEAPADSMIYSTAEAPAVSMIYSTAEAPAVSMIYSTAEAPAVSMIYSTAEAPADSMYCNKNSFEGNKPCIDIIS